MTYQKYVATTFSKELKQALKTKEMSKDVSDVLLSVVEDLMTRHEDDLRHHLTGKKKQRKRDGPPRPNWQAYWTSNDVGCRAYEPFQCKLQELQSGRTDDGKEKGRFAVNKELRQWAEGCGQYAAWKEWATTQLEAAGKPIPPETNDKPEVVEKSKSKSKPVAASAKDVSAASAASVAKDTVAKDAAASDAVAKPRGKGGRKPGAKVAATTAVAA